MAVTVPKWLMMAFTTCFMHSKNEDAMSAVSQHFLKIETYGSLNTTMHFWHLKALSHDVWVIKMQSGHGQCAPTSRYAYVRCTLGLGHFIL